MSRTLLTVLTWALCVGAIASAGLAAGNSYYVSTAGNDSAAGDSAHPWKTLQKAANVVNAGDTVNVLAGSYTGFYCSRSGNATSPITFLAQPGVNITANETHFNRDGITIYGGSYVVVDGFTVTGRTRAGISSQNNNHVTIRDCNCDSNGTWGIFTGFSDYFTAEDNVCSRSGTQHGIYVGNSTDYPTIRGNIIWGNAGCGLHMNGDISMGGGDGQVQYALVENNIIYNNGSPGGGSGINGDGVQYSTIRNNLLYNNHAGGISLYDGDAAAGPRDDIVENNTIIMASDGRWDINVSSGLGNITLRNNILYTNNSGRGIIEISPGTWSAGFVSDYNIIMGGNVFCDDLDPVSGNETRISLASWQSQTGNDKHSVVATPAQLFVGPTTNDYHLLATSPARDAGTSTNAPPADMRGLLRPIKNTYDIGAYEYDLAGDANCDGTVSFADYIALANNFGSVSAAWTLGDFNDDGKVTFADYVLLANNFGQSVPEPATLGLLLAGAGMLMRRKRS